MQDCKLSPTRLASYAAMAAGTVAAGAHADVRGYYGSPIPISRTGFDTVILEAGGVQFEAFKAFNSTFGGETSVNFSSACCEYGKSGGCISTRSIGTQSSFVQGQLSFEDCVDVLRIQSFVNEGQQVDDAIFTYGNCNVFLTTGEYTRTVVDCDSTTIDGSTYYEHFLALELADPTSGETYFGWLQIDGSYGDSRIVAWAFEDSGGPITIGDRGEKPITCQQADLNGDGKVDAADLGLILGFWGDCE